MPLPGPASQIACGDYHTVVLLATGEVMTFGQYTVRGYIAVLMNTIMYVGTYIMYIGTSNFSTERQLDWC